MRLTKFANKVAQRLAAPGRLGGVVLGRVFFLRRQRQLTAAALLFGCGLLAMLAGHALQLGLENIHAFSGMRAAYTHVAQAPAAVLAVMVLLAAMLALAARLLVSLRSSAHSSAVLLPGLEALYRLGAVRIAASVLAVQLAALVALEFIEQLASGYGRLDAAALFGTGHISSLLVHLIVGAAVAAALWGLSTHACRNVRAVAHLASLILNLERRTALPSGPHPTASTLRTHAMRADALMAPVLARRLANRPPPFAA